MQVNGPAWCSDVMVSYGEPRWIGVIMTNINNSKWVVLFTRSSYLADWEVLDGSYLSGRDTQAFFVGSIQECYDFCNRYSRHEEGWVKMESSILDLSRKYTADLFSKCKADEYGRERTETLSIQLIPA